MKTQMDRILSLPRGWDRQPDKTAVPHGVSMVREELGTVLEKLARSHCEEVRGSFSERP